MKSSIFKQLLLIGMAASIFVILSFRIFGAKNTWNDFFSKPKQQEAKLLQKPTPLERTREIDARISGSGKFKESQPINFVFSQMCHAIITSRGCVSKNPATSIGGACSRE